MSKLARYVLAELMKVFSVALIVVTSIFLLLGVVNEAVRQNLGLKQIVLLLPYVLPDAMRFAVPAAILFAACSVYGRLSSSNEVVAIKSMGISPMVILWPTFIFAFLLSLATVWLNDVAVSWGRQGAMRVVIESAEEIAYSTLRTKRSFSTPKFSINVKDVVGKRLIRPIFTFQSTRDAPTITASAQEAELRANPDNDTLNILIYDAVIEMGGVRSYVPFYEREIPLDQATRQKGSADGPSNLAMSEIPRERREQELENEAQERLMATTAAFQMLTGDLAGLSSDSWDSHKARLTNGQQRLNRLDMEPHRRWANGFSCLCFVAVGAPFAIVWRRADFLSVFFACFLPILLVYYPLLLGGVDQVKSGALPSYSVWAGNTLLLVWGAWLTKRVVRY